MVSIAIISICDLIEYAMTLYVKMEWEYQNSE